jgi:hypothetical protein
MLNPIIKFDADWFKIWISCVTILSDLYMYSLKSFRQRPRASCSITDLSYTSTYFLYSTSLVSSHVTPLPNCTRTFWAHSQSSNRVSQRHYQRDLPYTIFRFRLLINKRQNSSLAIVVLVPLQSHIAYRNTQVKLRTKFTVAYGS